MSIKGSVFSGTHSVLRFGMVGGGLGAFIGDVHRKGATFDGLARLEAGCFSRDFANTLATGEQWGVGRERLYRTYEEMARAEGGREDGIDFVIIATPNNTHYAAAKAFLENGIHVVCDKPLALTSQMGEELKALADEKGLLICVTHTYLGYPMVRQAREMVLRGDIGKVRVVSGRYIQGWLATQAENEGNKQAVWRCDPAQSGISGCVGDIGTHLNNLAGYITGLGIGSLCANLESAFDRPLDNNAEILIRYAGGGSAVLWCSQLAVGYDNDLRICVVGEKGSIEWVQENPNYLSVSMLGEPTKILSRGNDYLYPSVLAMNRIPAGHVEGHFTAFANVYRAFIAALNDLNEGKPLVIDFPTVDDGIEGNRFVERCVQSSKAGGTWVSF